MEEFDIGQVEIIPFTLKYLEDVREIHYPIMDGWSMKGIISDFANTSTVSCIAVLGGRALGFISYLLGDNAYMQFVCTHQMYRRRGIATKLITQTIEGMPEQINSVVLEVRSRNEEAINLYKKLGFATLGTRKDIYTTPLDDALVMEYTKGVKDLD